MKLVGTAHPQAPSESGDDYVLHLSDEEALLQVDAILSASTSAISREQYVFRLVPDRENAQ